MNNMKRIFILLLITTLWGVQDNISAQQLQKENNTPEVQGIIKRHNRILLSEQQL